MGTNEKPMGCDKKGLRFYIATYGWPMGAVLYDYRAVFEQNQVNIG